MPRPVQSPAAQLGAAPTSPSPSAQSTASAGARPAARRELAANSPRFREALHKAGRKPESGHSAAVAERSAPPKKGSASSKAGRGRRAHKPTGKHGAQDEDESSATDEVNEGD